MITTLWLKRPLNLELAHVQNAPARIADALIALPALVMNTARKVVHSVAPAVARNRYGNSCTNESPFFLRGFSFT